MAWQTSARTAPEQRFSASSDRQIARALLVACILSGAGGSMDAWVYIGHGQVFANAQTGNVVLFAIDLAAGRYDAALRHLPSMLAFCLGIVASRLSGAGLKRLGVNSRNIRLTVQAVGLVLVAALAAHLSDIVVTAAVGFIAAVQITALSHIGTLSFNTGMTTGNLRSALSAASAFWLDRTRIDKGHQALALGALCLSFLAGAFAGGQATLAWGNPALFATGAAVILAVAVGWTMPDPVR